ncbi:MAG: Alpha,6-mannosyltransferase [Frankiales bacterium]|nr:Alpha,6-mannosyltransferase [Frankiales bacterium]
MSDTLARERVPDRLRERPSVLFRAAGAGGFALTAGVAVAAAYAGVTQQVRLPDWWGPWPVRPAGQLDGWVVTGLVMLGALCMLCAWLAAAMMRRSRAGTLWGLAGWGDPDQGAHRTRLRTVLGLVAAWALPFLLSGPIGSLDVQSYAADGRLAGLGLDPYQATPGWLADGYGGGVDPLWRWTPAPYGPLQILLLRGLVHAAGPHVGLAVLLIRGVAVLGFVAALVLTLRAVRPSDRAAVLVVTALNPVVLVHVVSGGHLDILIGVLALLVVGLSRDGRPALAMTFAVVACAIKLPGAVLAAFVLLDLLHRTAGPERARALLRAVGAGVGTAAVIIVLCPNPFGWVAALNVPGVVRNGAAPSTWASYLAALLTGHLSGSGLDFSFTVGRMATGMLGAGAVLALLWRAASGTTRQAFRGVGWALITLAVTGPALYPWYLTWGLFAAAVGSGPRGRLVLVALGSATSLAAALGPGWLVLAAWIVIMLVVLGFTAWVGRAHWPARPGAPAAGDLPVEPGSYEHWPRERRRDDVPAI